MRWETRHLATKIRWLATTKGRATGYRLGITSVMTQWLAEYTPQYSVRPLCSQCARCKTRGVIHHSVQERQQQGLWCQYKHSSADFKTKEIFRAMGTGSVSRGEKRQGRDGDHPSLSTSEVKEGVEPYIYSSAPSWSVTAWTLLLTLLYELKVSYRKSSSPVYHSAAYYGSQGSNPGYHDVGFYFVTLCISGKRWGSTLN